MMDKTVVEFCKVFDKTILHVNISVFWTLIKEYICNLGSSNLSLNRFQNIWQGNLFYGSNILRLSTLFKILITI